MFIKKLQKVTIVPSSDWLSNNYTSTVEYLYLTNRIEKFLIFRSNRPFPSGKVTVYGQKPSNHAFYLIFLEAT